MTEADNPEKNLDIPAEKAADASSPEPGNRGTLSFIALFVVIVLGLLTSYRYAIDTRLNDWYLFTVAKHTAFVLNAIGDSAVLEDNRRIQVSPAEARASMAAWQRGEKEATPEAIAAELNSPLSAWESWSYRALKKRHLSPHLHDGPHVTYVYKPGLFTKIMELESRRNFTQLADSAGPAEKEKMLAQINLELFELQRQRNELMKEFEDYKSQRKELYFSFIIIPECGAIEIMAIFLAAVLAFPTTIEKRIWGAVFGVPLMYAVNIFRLTCLGIIGALDQGGKWFNFAHEYVWQVVYIVFVVVVWLLWVEFVVRRRQEQ